MSCAVSAMTMFRREQNAADDLPGMRGRIVRADGGELGHTRTVEEAVLVRFPDTPDFQRLVRGSFGDICHQPFSAANGRAAQRQAR